LFESISRWYSQIVYILGRVDYQKLSVRDALKIRTKLRNVNALPDTLGIFVGK